MRTIVSKRLLQKINQVKNTYGVTVRVLAEEGQPYTTKQNLSFNVQASEVFIEMDLEKLQAGAAEFWAAVDAARG